MLAELRGELEEKVFLAIMAGDESKAIDAISKAEAAGVDANRIALFQGQMHLYYGRNVEALQMLEPIAETSVAAKGLMATAHTNLMNWETQEETLQELSTLIEKSDDQLLYEDKLFAGYAMINSDMVLGRKLVTEALGERPDSPFRAVDQFSDARMLWSQHPPSRRDTDCP